MWNDPIVEEIRKIREAHAAKFNYDLQAIYRDIKEQERKSPFKIVCGKAKQPSADPNSASGA